MNSEDLIIAEKTLEILKDDKVRGNHTLKNYLFGLFKNSELNPYRDYNDIFRELESLGLITIQKETSRSHRLKITPEGIKAKSVKEFLDDFDRQEEIRKKQLNHQIEVDDLNRENLKGQVWNNKYSLLIQSVISILSALIGAFGGAIAQKYFDIF